MLVKKTNLLLTNINRKMSHVINPNCVQSNMPKVCSQLNDNVRKLLA